MQSTWKFPHHEVDGDGNPGAANVRAGQTGIGVLNGGRGGTTIPDADRQGVWNHLARHLRDADVEPPELKAFGKEGRRNSGQDLEHIQAIHDRACALGAKCAALSADSGAGGEGDGNDETGNGKSKDLQPSTLAARVALELLEQSIEG